MEFLTEDICANIRLIQAQQERFLWRSILEGGAEVELYGLVASESASYQNEAQTTGLCLSRTGGESCAQEDESLSEEQLGMRYSVGGTPRWVFGVMPGLK